LDDTVIRSDVTNLLKLARNTFFSNARTRLPFQGVAEFYSALQWTHETYNPIFYVSNGPYNLYELIVDFFEVRGIPIGPIFLRDIGLTEQFLFASKEHKYDTIEQLLLLYPNLPFILIGDSGEKDAPIYLQVIENHPGRIKAVYIRDVYANIARPDHDAKMRQIAEKAQKEGVDMLLVPDTAAAAVHAAEHGYIPESKLAEIMDAAEQDKMPNDLEVLIDEATDEP
jgi:phosphatidate phosphatase APP1